MHASNLKKILSIWNLFHQVHEQRGKHEQDERNVSKRIEMILFYKRIKKNHTGLLAMKKYTVSK